MASGDGSGATGYDVKLLDGGFSSQLILRLNMEDKECNNHPLWCTRFLVDNPQCVINTHRDFVRAGSDIIITNSYQASIEGFQKHLNLTYSESYDLIQKSVRYAKNAIEAENTLIKQQGNTPKKVCIAGSVGPYGACLHDASEYRGDYIHRVTPEFLKEWHRPRIDALVNEGVDYLAIETMPALMEAEALLELLKEYPNQKAWISFTCKHEKHTVFGDEIQKVAKTLWPRSAGQLVAIGVNCLHPSLVTEITNAIANSGEKQPVPTIAYPNNGEKYDDQLKMWVHMEGYPPLEQYIVEWTKAGINFIGGCCRTTASDIKMFREYIDRRR